MKNSLIHGKKAEDFACRFLKKQGLKLLTRNYRCRLGEIDLIMRDSGVIVFVEVRLRNHHAFGDGIASVDYPKQRRIINTAELYLQHFSANVDVDGRFDILALQSIDGNFKVNWLKSAFTA